jgi:TfoX/Sxy family transcriptional regulator of competence genes
VASSSDVRSARARADTAGTVYDPHLVLARLVELAEDLSFQVTSTPMMGGFVGYADGRTFVSTLNGRLRSKAPPGDQERALTRPGAARMRHAPEEPESKSYITFSENDAADDEFMVKWLMLAARTAPATKRR